MFALPRAGIALSIAMTCALIVGAVRLLYFGNWSWIALSVGLASPALAVLMVMLVLRLFRVLDRPAGFGEGGLIAAMHTVCTVAATSALATAYPDMAANPEFSSAFAWVEPGVWLPLLGLEVVLVPVAARG